MHQTNIVARRLEHPRRGDTTKVVLITLAVIFGSLFLLCAGVGIGGYFWLKQNFGQAFVNDPAVIQQMTTEVADLTLPSEFTPYSGTRIFGMTILTYRWCPEGNCPPAAGFDENAAADENVDVDLETTYDMLTLSAFAMETDGAENVAEEDPDYMEYEFSEEGLKERYNHHTLEKQELTIKGRACTFYIVQGEEKVWTPEMDSEPEAMLDNDSEQVISAEESATTPADPAATENPVTDPNVAATEPVTTEPAATDPAAPAETAAPTQPGRKVVEVQGIFPGKTSDVTLRFYVSAEKYDQAKVLQLLKSIK